MTPQRVALVRGPGLSSYEMQSYEPLMDRYALEAFALERNAADTSGLRIPVQRLRWKDAIGGRSVSNAYRSRIRKQRYFMPGLENRLEGFDIVHSAEITSTFSGQVADVQRRYGFRMVVTSTENIPFPAWNDPERSATKERILAATHRFMALTDDARKVLELEGVPSDRIDVIPFGVDLDRFRPATDRSLRGRIGLDSTFVVLFVGRLVWEKGIYDLVAALHWLEPGSAVVVFAGSGPERQSLEAFAAKCGVGQAVRFLAPLPYSQVHDLYGAADVVVLPSIPTAGIREQFGLVLVEAMASGVPVVGTRCGSIPWVIDDAGLLVDPASPASLGAGLAELQGNATLRSELGRRGRQAAVRRFDRNTVARQIDTVYQRVLEESGP